MYFAYTLVDSIIGLFTALWAAPHAHRGIWPIGAGFMVLVVARLAPVPPTARHRKYWKFRSH